MRLFRDCAVVSFCINQPSEIMLFWHKYSSKTLFIHKAFRNVGFLFFSLSINNVPLFYAAQKNNAGCIKKLLGCSSTNIFERGEVRQRRRQYAVYFGAACSPKLIPLLRCSRRNGSSHCSDERQPGRCCGSDGRGSRAHQRTHDLRAFPRLEVFPKSCEILLLLFTTF